MEKPTLEEVKEHFKNAKEVKSSWSGIVFEYKGIVNESKGEYFHADRYILYDKATGYSEIVSYKEPLKQTVKELLKGSEFENEDWTFSCENYFEFKEGLKFDNRKTKLTMQQLEEMVGYKFEII
jgi:hypothetical protein